MSLTALREQVGEVRTKARAMRHNIIDMIGYDNGRSGHLGGSMSAVEIVASLYFYKMRWNPDRLDDPDRDRFLLSKGHAALVQYAAFCQAGLISESDLSGVKTLASGLQGHPDMRKTKGIEANTGSLGQGLSIGLGMALGLRLDRSPARVYVLMGDGELQEGQIWEAAMAAAAYRADNLVGIVDRNSVQATGPVKDSVDRGSVKSKFEAFGWNVKEIDGHDTAAICRSLDEFDEVKGLPSLLLCDTVKGKYISFAEGRAEFHNASLTERQFRTAHDDVDTYAAR